MSVYESDVEEAAIGWFRSLGYDYAPGPDIAPDGCAAERATWGDVVLEGRLQAALARINPHLTAGTLDDVTRRVLRAESPVLEEDNCAFQRLLTKGVQVQVRRGDAVRGDLAWLVDFQDPANNDWLVVNQLTVVEDAAKRRPDVVVFLNGMPVAVVELKNPEDPNATLKTAWNQLQTYKKDIPGLFRTNEVLVVSDGLLARLGSLTAGFEWFGPWRTVDGSELAPDSVLKLRVLVEGVFEPRRFLDLVRHFVLWETEDGHVKKLAGYHQLHAVNKAVAATLTAVRPEGDRRIGVIWHTQGSGKSIAMLFYVGKVIVEPALENPTVVVLTDRNDLDGQLFAQFCAAKDLLPAPVRAESREHLKELLQVASGGIVFTTIQKFGVAKGERYPMLSDRRNIVVIADEAHRSQYEFIEGFARNVRDALPGAAYLGFTGTPIEFDDRNTPAVFGDYIDTYTISQSVEDGKTVRLHYEARLARIALPEEEKPRLDEGFEDVTEGEEEEVKSKLKTKWAKLEALVGAEERLALVAKDIVEHWERRSEILEGKALIVAMSRRIAVDLYQHIVNLRPAGHSAEDAEGAIKVVMTGSAGDPTHFQPHIRNRERQKAIEKRFKDPEDPLKLVIVRDMWLTGFDVPCAHTMYADKPMRGHGLMQAIARVNRVFQDKPHGLVVDYLGLADQLRKAVTTYGGRRSEPPGVPVEQALAVLLEKFEVVKALFHGFDYFGYFAGSPEARLMALNGGANHICALEDGKKRYMDAMAALNKAAGIAIHLEGARHLRDEVGYFQAVQAALRKVTPGKDEEELDAAIKQIVSAAVASDGVVDIFGAAGLAKPDISILSDEFLETVKASPYRNLQLEVLRKLLNDEIRGLQRQNVVQARRFSEMLSDTLVRYQNRTVEAAEIILELIALAKELRDAPKRGEVLGLDEDELAFYDALADHGDVREVMGDGALAAVAHDLVESIRRSVTIDWTQKQSVRADMRRKIKRLLRRHGYPPDKQQSAVETVIQQAEARCRDWAETPTATTAAEEPARVLPFRRLRPEEVQPFVNAVPLYDLKVAAGRFGEEQVVDEVPQADEVANPEDYEWVDPGGSRRPGPGLFVARVVGESMNRRIPNGAWCLFRLDPTGTRQGRVVLAQHREITDAEHGGHYTLKVYESAREPDGEGGWRHRRVILKPDSTEPAFEALVLEGLEDGALGIIAELVEVLV